MKIKNMFPALIAFAKSCTVHGPEKTPTKLPPWTIQSNHARRIHPKRIYRGVGKPAGNKLARNMLRYQRKMTHLFPGYAWRWD